VELFCKINESIGLAVGDSVVESGRLHVWLTNEVLVLSQV
jgi:hypothetical protein